MKERINVLASGIADQILPLPVLSQNRIEEEIRAGIPVRGEFSIYSGNEASLKGVVYSDHHRVHVKERGFAGSRCQIQYIADTRFLDSESKIEGSFFLITNGGELELPFCFSLGADGSQEEGKLDSIQAFTQLAAADIDVALRLFEYDGFRQFPFMQDLTLRTIYDGLSGRGQRLHSLEEFLIASAAKDPVTIGIRKREMNFPYEEEAQLSHITIEKNTWGYLRIDVTSDAEFLVPEKNTISAEDFNGNRYDFPFRIDYGKLHSGRNYGTIKFLTPSQEINVDLLVLGRSRTKEDKKQDKNFFHTYMRYLELRLDYENGHYQEQLTLGRMQTELEYLMNIRDVQWTALLLAEVFILGKEYDKAFTILEERRAAVSEHRTEHFEEYCFFQYLMSMIPGNGVDRESLLRLLHKYTEEEPERFYLFLILLKMEPDLLQNKTVLLLKMKELYRSGCNSPFLYSKACELFNESPHFLRALDSFELQVLLFGVKRGRIGEELALKAAELSSLEKGCRKIYFRILRELYKKFPHNAILEGICSILIKGNCQSKDLFCWFEKGVEEELRLTRLFEYYLFTLPPYYEKPLPMELFLYFSYSHTLDCGSRELLYCNLLTHVNAGIPVFEAYERQIEEFALSCLFKGRMNDRMSFIYSKIIYKELIDERIAEVFPDLLCSCRIECKQPAIRYVVVRYEELKEERVFPVEQGIAYVPIYAKDCILLFQDAYGSRYYEVDYKVTRLMREPELERCCFQLCPEHIMLEIRFCREVLESGLIDERQAKRLEGILRRDLLHDLYASELITKLIQFYSVWDGEGDVSFLASLDKSALAPGDRASVCEVLIARGHFKAAYEMVLVYGYEQISSSRLLKLTSKMILENLFEEDETLLSLSLALFRKGLHDSVVLDYLCEHFNGSVKEMYLILTCALEAHKETSRLEERLLVQMLFTGTAEKLDEVFLLYSENRDGQSSVVKAYLTVKSSLFVTKDVPAARDVFEALERELQRGQAITECPVIWQLAVLKHYSIQAELGGEQLERCQKLLENLIKQKMIFAFMQELGRFVDLPAEIRGRAMIEYKGTKGSDIAIRMRILPDHTGTHVEGMPHVYEGVFLKQILLFDGETLEYEILERTKDGIKTVDSGIRTRRDVPAAGGQGVSNDRFCRLNGISLSLEIGEEKKLWDTMSEYVIMDQVTEKLFG